MPPNPEIYLLQEAGIELPIGCPMQAHFFKRYGERWQGIFLLPDNAIANWSPRITQLDRRGQPSAPASAQTQITGSDALYVPPRRTRAIDGGDKWRIVAERIDCREVSLRCTPTRTSAWGVDLNRLKYDKEMDASIPSFGRWLAVNGLPPFENIQEEARTLLHAAFAVAITEKNDPAKKFRAPRLPLIHNQRSGTRYILAFDKRNMGSPADIHILLYPSDSQKPNFVSLETTNRPTADERKPGLLLLASRDMRIRFYKTTEAQSKEWKKHPIDYAALPDSVRTLTQAACAKAE